MRTVEISVNLINVVVAGDAGVIMARGYAYVKIEYARYLSSSVGNYRI